MRFSNMFIPTLRDDPADAEVVSHRLLVRAGFIRRVTSGVYNLLPLGLKVLNKVEEIVREEMASVGAQEMLMPIVQPADLWKQSGRWDKYGRELMRLKDRHDHESCLGPTHEEVVCDLMSRELRSWRQLPITLYQIQGKFRDEVRPRFGLMRGREFIMKDAYSFHADDEDLQREYKKMFAAYQRIFHRLGLTFRAVEADTGSIGGSCSHEFHVLAESGEDAIVHCDSCDYAANVELAVTSRACPNGEGGELETVSTPSMKSAEDVAGFLSVDAGLLVKTMLYRVEGGEFDGRIIAAMVRGDDQVQEMKLKHALTSKVVELASDADIRNVGGVTGFVGPVGLDCPLFVDMRLQGAVGLVAGANQVDSHVRNLDVERDMTNATLIDLRTAREDDCCQRCDGTVSISRGIEVGHIFELGRCYAEPMQVFFQDKDGKRATATMGCYGIGISRLVAAIVEQCHDEKGICWPKHMAPFDLVVIPVGKSEQVAEVSERIYSQGCAAGFDLLLDDRRDRPGSKFRDAELLGIPARIVIGDRSLERGEVEFQPRVGEAELVPLEQVQAKIHAFIGTT
ncbi:MAG: proline--tRNA ligase [Mariprofundaceae bacterium]